MSRQRRSTCWLGVRARAAAQVRQVGERKGRLLRQLALQQYWLCYRAPHRSSHMWVRIMFCYLAACSLLQKRRRDLRKRQRRAVKGKRNSQILQHLVLSSPGSSGLSGRQTPGRHPRALHQQSWLSCRLRRRGPLLGLLRSLAPLSTTMRHLRRTLEQQRRPPQRWQQQRRLTIPLGMCRRLGLSWRHWRTPSHAAPGAPDGAGGDRGGGVALGVGQLRTGACCIAPSLPGK